jgi:hypothetical protein
METLITFCRKTARRVSRLVNAMLRRVSNKGQPKLSLAITIPFFAKFEIGYQLDLERAE